MERDGSIMGFEVMRPNMARIAEGVSGSSHFKRCFAWFKGFLRVSDTLPDLVVNMVRG